MASRSAHKIPHLVYGTAWKKDATAELVHQALLAGFRGVDTAAQPKHYQEELVGAGIRSALQNAGIKREDLYIQTKYTSIQGQDPKKMPYDPRSTITNQVKASVKSSLRNLRTSEDGGGADDYIDCLVLHSPLPTFEQTYEAWTAMESFVPDSIKTLGISNIYQLPVLRRLYETVSVKPSVVQNRFYPDTGFDKDIRQFCQENEITYQSFWTLTANPRLLKSETVKSVAQWAGVSVEVALYALVIALSDKMSVLNGTTNENRMSSDLRGLAQLTTWTAENEALWSETRASFEALLR